MGLGAVDFPNSDLGESRARCPFGYTLCPELSE
jgi:hypothetical protein